MSQTTLNRDFLLGGKAEFVFQNPQGTKYRFRVRASKPTPQFPNPAYFVNMHAPASPASKWGWLYLGILRVHNSGNSASIKTSAKSGLSKDETAFKVAEWALELMMSGTAAPDGYILNHVGKCGRCGRKLTDTESIKRGIGPECNRQINMKPGGVSADEPTEARFVGESGDYGYGYSEPDEADVNGNHAVA